MKMFISLRYLIIFITLASCTKVDAKFEPINLSKYETISFDAVEKELSIDTTLPVNVANHLKYWFSEKVKVNGFEGSLLLIINNYQEIVSNIDNGKKVEIMIDFSIRVEKASSKMEFINGQIKEFSSITGDFSLLEVDSMIESTQKNIIFRLSQDLRSKI